MSTVLSKRLPAVYLAASMQSEQAAQFAALFRSRGFDVVDASAQHTKHETSIEQLTNQIRRCDFYVMDAWHSPTVPYIGVGIAFALRRCIIAVGSLGPDHILTPFCVPTNEDAVRVAEKTCAFTPNILQAPQPPETTNIETVVDVLYAADEGAQSVPNKI